MQLMWATRHRKEIIKNIVLALLCMIVAIGLFFAVKTVRAQAEQESASLSMKYQKQKSEQTVEKQSLVGDIDAEYQKDLDTVAKYLPGIVCWGDTLTYGSSGTVSYPYILQKYIDTYICDIYDFMGSIENAGEFSRLDWDKYKVSIPVINMGVPDEDTTTVLGRSGVLPYVLKEDVTIPSQAEPAEIKIVSQNGKTVSPLSGGNGGINNVTINGIEGILSLETDETVYWENKVQYYFTRLEAGKESIAPKETPIIPAASEKYRDYIHIVCIGTYGDYETANDLVEQIKLLLSRQTANTDRYLVLGTCYETKYHTGWKDMSPYETVLVQAFGDHFINIRDYLCSDGMADAGIKPTITEERDAAKGIVPKCLRSSSGNAGLSASAYRLIGKVVYDRMEQLGYFDEVKDELNIMESQKKALKEDPEYFSNIIRNWQ